MALSAPGTPRLPQTVSPGGIAPRQAPAAVPGAAVAPPRAAPGAAPSTPGPLGWLSGYQSVGQRPSPNGDPQYLAYLRNLGLQEQTAFAHAGQSATGENNRYTLELGDQAATDPITQRNLNGSYEDRGIYRSGEHGVALGDLLAAQTRQRGNLGLQHVDASQQIRQQLEDTLVGLAKQRADQELALQVRQASKGLANVGPFSTTGL